MLANSPRYPATPRMLAALAGVYDAVLYRARKQAGVIVLAQLLEIVAFERGVNAASFSSSSVIGLTSGCKKLVAFILLSVPKYVVGAITSTWEWSSFGRE